ncbi:ArsA family ATPase [Conexibacter sp. DBS9H8]|uniref:ArsA family ATPase n=1 Tax=Conexibacter sp. DBS9H8 TaxID=2937801 RepID=UPI00200EE138|nr:ArsA family ATPase [Conexibacter sp. DBS9H8]
MPALLDHRLIFVTGKGGVGKTTIARGLGLLGAQQGRRVIIAELTPTCPEGGIAEIELDENLFFIAVDPQAAMEEYLRIKGGAVGSVLAHSRLFATLAMATPGLRELLGMGKIWELAQLERRTRDGDAYDLVVVDAPATGHGVAALRTPRVFADTARVGPIAAHAAAIATTIAEPDFTAVVAVTVAEEMPVRETLSLADTLADDGLQLDAVVLNQHRAARFSAEEDEQIAAALAARSPIRPGDAVAGALSAARSARARAEAQREHADALTARFGDRLVRVPALSDDPEGLAPAVAHALVKGL